VVEVAVNFKAKETFSTSIRVGVIALTVAVGTATLDYPAFHSVKRLAVVIASRNKVKEIVGRVGNHVAKDSNYDSPFCRLQNHNWIILGESLHLAYCCYGQCGNKGKAKAPV